MGVQDGIAGDKPNYEILGDIILNPSQCDQQFQSLVGRKHGYRRVEVVVLQLKKPATFV
jgi:hypothetical protein